MEGSLMVMENGAFWKRPRLVQPIMPILESDGGLGKDSKENNPGSDLWGVRKVNQ